MLYRVIIGNYKSFAEEVQFDMFPNLKRENFNNHVYMGGPIPVLKECAIYGANGAGKSNFIKAMAFLKDFATNENSMRDKEWLKSWYLKNRYKLPVIDENMPINLLIEFSVEDRAYLYVVEVDAEGVKTENLYLSGLGKGPNIAILERNRNKIEFKATIVGEEVKKIFERQLAVNPAVSILALNGTLHLTEDPSMEDAYNWMRDGLDIVEVNRQIPWLIDQLKKHSQVMDFVNTIFSKIGLGITSLEIKDENFDTWVENATREDKEVLNNIFTPNTPVGAGQSVSKRGIDVPVLEITEEKGKRMVREFIFSQMGKGGYTGMMDVTTQSTGTLRLLTLVPALYYAIYSDKTVMVDEIDNGIHPMLMKKLVKYFGQSQSQGQLIFTTHETPLLNQQELLRADEVWLVEKVEGCTKMYSLNDFKIHKTLSIENGYMEGRFGAIPFIGTLD